MWISESSHGPVQSSEGIGREITGPPHCASCGDFCGLKAAGACVYGCGCITMSLWQSGLWEQTASSVSERKRVCPGWASFGGCCMLVQLSHLSVKWKRLLQQSDSHLFSKCCRVICWADTRSWQYMLKGYWSHQSACAWLLLYCGFSCPVSSWRTV